eukprot:Amastigsp_a340438_9.p2 type:complete len:164 gc:universal Amastigsp_a340438_9:520-29(-)
MCRVDVAREHHHNRPVCPRRSEHRVRSRIELRAPLEAPQRVLGPELLEIHRRDVKPHGVDARGLKVAASQHAPHRHPHKSLRAARHAPGARASERDFCPRLGCGGRIRFALGRSAGRCRLGRGARLCGNRRPGHGNEPACRTRERGSSDRDAASRRRCARCKR